MSDSERSHPGLLLCPTESPRHHHELRSDAVQRCCGACCGTEPLAAASVGLNGRHAVAAGWHLRRLFAAPHTCLPHVQYAEVLPAMLDFADSFKWMLWHDQVSRGQVAHSLPCQPTAVPTGCLKDALLL